MSTRDPDAARTVTVRTLAEFKREGRKFACLTAYDATFSRILDEAGVDIILVGDSLGMVVQGLDTTIPVSMDDMAYHTRLVARGCKRALLMVDMPFMSFSTTEQALRNATRLMQEGMAHMVKLEGGDMELETVTQLSRRGVPVCAHIGLRPQSVHQLGGYQRARAGGVGRGGDADARHDSSRGWRLGVAARVCPVHVGAADYRGRADPGDWHRGGSAL